MFLGGPPIDFDFLLAADWWRRVDMSDVDGCWPWLQSAGSHGYGQTWDGVTVRLAHRVAWALANESQIPDGMTVDHACRNRRCCNPEHLRLLRNVDNARDNGMARRTHCPAGHQYDEINTIRTREGWRNCRTCANTRRHVA